jgi:ribosome-associated toxin RatA of RatAB toxin-antitoxin module
MSEFRNEITIAAAPERVYSYAAATERWPEFLPHYRYVRVLDGDASHRIVEMAARRDFIPVRWRAEQWNDPATPSIRFHHIAGWTRGMDVEWQFERLGEATRVTIVHHFDSALPVVGGIFARNVVGRLFVENIANKTLARMKVLAEAEGARE